MKRKRFSEQIAFALRQAESGTTIEEICREMGVCRSRRSIAGRRFMPGWGSARFGA